MRKKKRLQLRTVSHNCMDSHTILWRTGIFRSLTLSGAVLYVGQAQGRGRGVRNTQLWKSCFLFQVLGGIKSNDDRLLPWPCLTWSLLPKPCHPPFLLHSVTILSSHSHSILLSASVLLFYFHIFVSLPHCQFLLQMNQIPALPFLSFLCLSWPPGSWAQPSHPCSADKILGELSCKT